MPRSVYPRELIGHAASHRYYPNRNSTAKDGLDATKPISTGSYRSRDSRALSDRCCCLFDPTLLRLPLARNDSHVASPNAVPQQQPPWTYGRLGARFTIVEHADLECPSAKAYFPVLRQWIEQHPDVSWQWQHLPLSMHDPSATHEARIAECAGEVRGNAAFWDTVAWIYQNTRGDGGGLPANVRLPGTSPAVVKCLASSRPDAAIRAQVIAAGNSKIAATPTLRLIDRQTGLDVDALRPYRRRCLSFRDRPTCHTWVRKSELQ